MEGSFGFAKLSTTKDSVQTAINEVTFEEENVVVEEGFAGTVSIKHGNPDASATSANTLAIDSVVVVDGQLTIGFRFGPVSQAFFNEVRLSMIGTAKDFDYKKAADEIKQEIIEGIEPQAAQAKVRALQLFDLNGRRITTARPGIVIVKKLMSDGSVRIEKVVKK